MDRREFVKTAAAGALTPLFVPRSAWGANDRIVYGTGNPGGGLNKVVQKLGGQRAALCDLYQPHLATPDHQHLPMHFRALDTRKNVYLEKPLSLTLDQSTRMISSRVRQSTQVVQIGMQRRSMGFIRQAKKMIDERAAGTISMVKAMWNRQFALPLDTSPPTGELDRNRFHGPAPQRPLEPVRFRWWRVRLSPPCARALSPIFPERKF